MDITEFLGLNVVAFGVLVGAVIVYLVILINKRRKSKFLHKDTTKNGGT